MRNIIRIVFCSEFLAIRQACLVLAEKEDISGFMKNLKTPKSERLAKQAKVIEKFAPWSINLPGIHVFNTLVTKDLLLKTTTAKLS